MGFFREYGLNLKIAKSHRSKQNLLCSTFSGIIKIIYLLIIHRSGGETRPLYFLLSIPLLCSKQNVAIDFGLDDFFIID